MKWEFDWEEDKGGNTLFPLPDTRYYYGISSPENS